MDGLLQVSRELRNEQGYSLVLIDVKELGALSPSVRKRAAAVMQADDGYTGALAICGASLLTGTLIKLMLRATRLFATPKRERTEHFAERAAAILWLKAQRAWLHSPA